MEDKGTLYFFTGLAGAGKTTLGELFFERLKVKKPRAVLLDGHRKRESFVAEGVARDYSLKTRLNGAYWMFRQCRMLTEEGRDVVCCSMALFDEIRTWNRRNIPNYKEIYLRVPMEILRQRRSELYSGKQTQVVGLDLPWDEPKTPDIVVDNDGRETPEATAARLAEELGIL